LFRLLLSVLIPGFYFFATGAPFRGALLLCAFALALNSALLTLLLPPFDGQPLLLLSAALGTSLLWALNIILAALSYRKKIEGFGEKDG